MAQEPVGVGAQKGIVLSSEIEQNIRKVDLEIHELERKKLSLIRELPIKCFLCKEESPTKDWTFVQMCYYEVDCCGLSRRAPHHCPIICPKCGKERDIEEEFRILNRIMNYGANLLFTRIEERHQR